MSKNAFENLRPDELLSALLIRPADPAAEKLYIEDDTDLDHSYSILQFARIGPGDTLQPDRNVWFDRLDLHIARQKILDAEGLIVSDARYEKWQNYGGVIFPSHIDITFKKDGYAVVMDIVDMQMNATVTDDKFALEQPAGSKLRVIGDSGR